MTWWRVKFSELRSCFCAVYSDEGGFLIDSMGFFSCFHSLPIVIKSADIERLFHGSCISSVGLHFSLDQMAILRIGEYLEYGSFPAHHDWVVYNIDLVIVTWVGLEPRCLREIRPVHIYNGKEIYNCSQIHDGAHKSWCKHLGIKTAINFKYHVKKAKKQYIGLFSIIANI